MQHTSHSSPLGATVVDGGVNFSLFALKRVSMK
jgi:hypothetical protein